MFRRTQFSPGSERSILIEKWKAWVMECHDMLGPEGTFASFPYPGARREQPAFDMAVLRTIKSEYVRLTNEANKPRSGNVGR